MKKSKKVAKRRTKRGGVTKRIPSTNKIIIDYSTIDYSGLDGDAYYQYDLDRWANEKPSPPSSSASEDAMAHYNEALRKWASRAPQNNQWNDGR